MPIIDSRFNPIDLYVVYHVVIRLRRRLCGGMPRNKELIKGWIEAKTGHKDEKAKALAEADAELIVNEVAEKTWVGFPEDVELGLFMETRKIKAMLKQSASLLQITKKKLGSKQILAEGMEVKSVEGSDRIYFGKKEPDGTDESPIHVKTPQGPRTALRRMDYMDQPTLKFDVWVLKTATQEKRHVGEDELVQILKHAQENGLGAARSQGEGKFDVIEFTKAE
jgi:hypothetical protein